MPSPLRETGMRAFGNITNVNVSVEMLSKLAPLSPLGKNQHSTLNIQHYKIVPQMPSPLRETGMRAFGGVHCKKSDTQHSTLQKSFPKVLRMRAF